ncbi:nucleoside/nucleotide kinase family protein [Sphingopyxis yananensis]|uniref:nucleoside triphosphate hydrolase n=1 Tax=Sphingopyxis yananensis TaxID=2886687 RepID=UPI001D10BE38|nr:nucleoside triphosphate hydrolase [Sphingopyxis yananensis]MCC2603177.1 nucleoside triphosphate hydrolase [Sphingopyxis yananensis]
MAENSSFQTLTGFDDRVAIDPKRSYASVEARAATADHRASTVRLPSLIAIIGCDGSGKSTLAADLATALSADRSVQSLYLGQDSGNILRAIVTIPLIGGMIGRFLVRKGRKAHANKDKSATPDTTTAIAIYILSRWRRHKFARMLRLHANGQVIIADRYPQAEVPGFYFDGRGLIGAAPSNAFVRALIAREQRLYEQMASYVPALIIRLHIDAESAHRRKPDHKLAMLREKTRVIPTLTFNGAPILELDGRHNYADVLNEALAAVRKALAAAPPAIAPNGS